MVGVIDTQSPMTGESPCLVITDGSHYCLVRNGWEPLFREAACDYDNLDTLGDVAFHGYKKMLCELTVREANDF